MIERNGLKKVQIQITFDRLVVVGKEKEGYLTKLYNFFFNNQYIKKNSFLIIIWEREKYATIFQATQQ